jgi:GT2 family glycosyltransferase
MNGRLSVVVTCFNQGVLIAPMLGALLDDLHENDEVIVADDGSTDQSLALIERAAADDHRVRILPGIASQSVSRTRNRGMQASTGDWISFLDGDDEYCAGRRDHLTRGMRAFPQASVLFTDYALWQPLGDQPHESRALEFKRVHDELLRIATGSGASALAAPVSSTTWRSVDHTELTLLLLQHGSVLHLCSLVISRAWIETHALQFDSRLIVAEDTDFVIQALQNASVVFLPVVTARYRISGNGLSARHDTAARMARVVQRMNNLQLPAAAPSTRGELSAWHQLGMAELQLAYQCRLDGYYYTAVRHALRSFVAIPKMQTLAEILKSVWLIMKTGAPEIRPIPIEQVVQSSGALTMRQQSSLSGEVARTANARDERVSAADEPRGAAAAEGARSDQHIPV